MRRVLLIPTAILLSSCANAVKAPQGNYFYSGVYSEGSNLFEPKPSSSKYMKITAGGFLASNSRATYRIYIDMFDNAPEDFFVKAMFENPLGSEEPYIEQGSFTSRQETLTLTHGPVPGLVIYKDYTVTVQIFNKKGDELPIDTVSQKIRSYVDTTGPETKVFEGLSLRE